MNPIELKSPDGRVYAYACGVCHHVRAGAEKWGHETTNGPHADLVEWSLRDATRCCTCMTCGRPGSWSYCENCERDIAARHMWSSIATCMQRGITTREQYDEYQQQEFDAFLRDED